MFFVINKEKIYAYIVSIITVAMLFVMAGVLTPKEDAAPTSANVQTDNQKYENSVIGDAVSDGINE